MKWSWPSLKRISPSTQYLSEVDGLRFLAIFPVVYLHLGTFYMRNTTTDWALPLDSDPLYRARAYCSLGVPLFYCLSGFILALPFGKEALGQRSRISVRGFYARRLTRLEPPYLLCLTVFLLAHIFVRGQTFSEVFPHYLASFFYLHNVIYGEWSTILPVAWTLEIEVQFYLLVPFVVRAYFSRGLIRRRMILLFFVLVFSLLEAYGREFLATYHLSRTLLTQGHYFAVGILASDLFVMDRDLFRRKSRVWDGLFILGLVCSRLCPFLGIRSVFDQLLFTSSLLLIFLAAFKGPVTNRLFRMPWVYLTGGMCYTIYLLHYPYFHLLGTYLGVVQPSGVFAIDFLLNLLLALPLLALVVVPYYLLLERPCMDKRWPGKLMAALGLRPRVASSADQVD